MSHGLPKITLIVPVYNVEKWLPQCMDSLVGQTLKDIEILCINDGSTDHSLDILESYAAKDQRIRIISQQNAGQGAARNRGIREAKGAYVGFVDSDDWLDVHFCEKMYEAALKNDAELVICQIHLYNDKTGQSFEKSEWADIPLFERFQGKVFSFEDTKEFYFNQITAVPWNKIYKTEFLRQNNLYFPEGIKYEDYPYFFKMYICVKRAVLCPHKLYFYRVNRLGSDATDIRKNGFTFLSHFNDIEETLRTHNRYPEMQYRFLQMKIMGLLYWLNKTPRRFKKEFYDLIQQEFRRMNLTPADFAQLPGYVKNSYLHTKKFNYYYYTYLRRTALKIFSITYDPETHIFRFRFLFFFKIKKRISK